MVASLRNWAKRTHLGQKGFTLIEMIVVVGIIAVLAAVIVPNIGKFIGTGEAGAKSAEQESVETAMSAMMADKAVQLVAPSTAGTNTNDWGTLPGSDGTDLGALPLYNTGAPEQSYIHMQVTVYCYQWDKFGNILPAPDGQTEVDASGIC